MRAASMMALAALAGCDARFTEIEVGSEPPSGNDAGGAPDAIPVSDASFGVDASTSDAAPPDASAPDAASPDGGSIGEVVVARGDWENAGYSVSGSSEIVQLTDGTFELRMSSDFLAADLPGPTLFFSDRERIGSSGVQADQGDILIARLDRVRGPLVFSIPAEAVERRFVWIYCEPFSVEMHVLELEAP